MKRIVILLMAAITAACTANSLQEEIEPSKETVGDIWELLSEDVTATVYNAVPSQCNEDCLHTASMYRVLPERVLQQRILAMERTMMSRYGLHYGDTLLVEGVGRWDGVWQLQDTMNKRFAGQEKIDLLVPNDIRSGKWTGVRVSVKRRR